jgi:hypothetical protein
VCLILAQVRPTKYLVRQKLKILVELLLAHELATLAREIN